MSKDRRAISGYAFLIDGGVVTWSSKKQEVVSLSMTESEYMAAAHGMKEVLWLKSLISQVFSPIPEPIDMLCDNQSAIALAQDHQYHTCSKHINIHFHFIHWLINNGSIHLTYCPTTNMITDVLTKAIPSPKVK